LIYGYCNCPWAVGNAKNIPDVENKTAVQLHGRIIKLWADKKKMGVLI
jgi:hypothetical protein